MIARERSVPLLLVVVRAVVGEPIILKDQKQQLQLLSYRQMIRHLFSSCSSSFNPDLSCPDVSKKNYMVSRRSTLINANPSFPSISQNRIMVVDDDPDLSILFKLSLEGSGFIVDMFNDPVLALSNYKEGFYDLLLLDIKMPKMDGFELYQNIKNKDNRVKVCFITAFEEYEREFKKSFPNLEEDCFIRKPIRVNELVEIVKAKLQCYK
jgi:two-component system, OmpR family, response regulator ChvI